MNKILLFILFLLLSAGSFAQVIGTVDKKTKEFFVPANQKIEYTVFGYQLANNTTPKTICFSSNTDVVRANSNCPLGAYFDTDGMKPGDKILYLGIAGSFAKMNFISGGGKHAIFYLPRSNFVIK